MFSVRAENDGYKIRPNVRHNAIFSLPSKSGVSKLFSGKSQMVTVLDFLNIFSLSLLLDNP